MCKHKWHYCLTFFFLFFNINVIQPIVLCWFTQFSSHFLPDIVLAFALPEFYRAWLMAISCLDASCKCVCIYINPQESIVQVHFWSVRTGYPHLVCQPLTDQNHLGNGHQPASVLPGLQTDQSESVSISYISFSLFWLDAHVTVYIIVHLTWIRSLLQFLHIV